MAQPSISNFCTKEKVMEVVAPVVKGDQYEDISSEQEGPEFGDEAELDYQIQVAAEVHREGEADQVTVAPPIHPDLKLPMGEFLEKMGWVAPKNLTSTPKAAHPTLAQQKAEMQRELDRMALQEQVEAEGASLAAEAALDPALQLSHMFDGESCVGGEELDSCWDEIDQLYNSEERLGEPVPDRAATFMNRALRSLLSPESEKDLLARYLRPSNLGNLVVPRVNQAVWRDLKKRTRESDLALQRGQNCIFRGMIPLVHSLTDLNAKHDKDNRKRLLDGLQAVALGAHHISTSRRSFMAQDIRPQFRQLCATSRPMTDMLFGPDQELEKQSRELKDAHTPGLRLGYGEEPSTGRPYTRGRGGGPAFSRGRGQRGHPYRGRGGSSGPFLGSRGSQSRRRGSHSKGAAAPSKTSKQ